MNTARDIALVFLSLEALVMGIVPLLLLAAAAYGTHRLHRWLGQALRRLTEHIEAIARKVERLSGRIAAPFITARSRWRQIDVMRRALAHTIFPARSKAR